MDSTYYSTDCVFFSLNKRLWAFVHIVSLLKLQFNMVFHLGISLLVWTPSWVRSTLQQVAGARVQLFLPTPFQEWNALEGSEYLPPPGPLSGSARIPPVVCSPLAAPPLLSTRTMKGCPFLSSATPWILGSSNPLPTQDPEWGVERVLGWSWLWGRGGPLDSNRADGKAICPCTLTNFPSDGWAKEGTGVVGYQLWDRTRAELNSMELSVIWNKISALWSQSPHQLYDAKYEPCGS